ncbi:MAG: InlB B-repeat-containing protein, partial [Clostridia bacterium]|nr:InlB B-repeat-containing protein [Clostridia bacterium]
MKKLISVLLILVMLTALAVSVNADDAAKTRLYNAAKDACPTAYHDRYLGIAQNILNQIDVTSEQADQVIALVEEGKAFFTTNKGPSLDAYTEEEIDKAVDLFERACAILSITAKVSAVADPEHEGDVIFKLYYNSDHIASIDGDVITTSSSSGSGAVIRPSYTVEFEVDGGSEITKIRVRQGSKIEEPETPVKEGFVFGGWYSDKALTKEFNFDNPITKKVTLYAKWITEEEDVKHYDNDPVDTTLKNTYDDVDEDACYYDAVKFDDENGL